MASAVCCTADASVARRALVVHSGHGLTEEATMDGSTVPHPGPSSASQYEKKSWTKPEVTELPRLTDLTLLTGSPIGGGGDTGGTGSTVF